MMPVRLDDHWSYHGLSVIRIENALLAADFIPSLGGKILHLLDKGGDRQLLWRNPRIAPYRPPLQSNVDDHFAGGWDDAFPTGDASRNRYGDELPYLGEIRTLHLTSSIVEAGPQRAVVVLEGHTPITTARWTRTITLERDQPALGLHTRIENVGYLPMDFNWGSHPAFLVHEATRVDVPATSGYVADAGGQKLGEVGDRYRYPWLRENNDQLDVRFVLSPWTGAYALHILEGLKGGWVAVTDQVVRRGFGVVFDPAIHRAVWQWMVYGGFRGWFHVIVEPWLAGPPSLTEAIAAGVARTLQPGEVFEAQMWGVLYSGVQGVADLQPDGTVVPP